MFVLFIPLVKWFLLPPLPQLLLLLLLEAAAAAVLLWTDVSLN
jgi:hypothetical protein